MPPKTPRQEVVVPVAPAQRMAFDAAAAAAGVSRRAHLEALVLSFLVAPTGLLPGGVYRGADRERVRFHVSIPVHAAIARLAEERGTTLTAVYATAISNAHPLPKTWR